MNLLRPWAFLLCAFVAGLGGKACAADSSSGEEEQGVAGIGIVADADTGGSRVHEFIRVGRVIDHSPASRAKLMAGDEILEIDGTRVAGMSLHEAVRKHLRGPLGSVVQILVVRPGQPGPHRYDLVRDVVPEDKPPAP